MRIIITGSRKWTDRVRLECAIDDAIGRALFDGHQSVTVVHGACPSGADRMASDYLGRVSEYFSADFEKIAEEKHPADWNRFGKRAGFKRNYEMVIAGADLCIAFIVPGQSNGTMHTVEAARAAGIPVTEVIAHG